MIRYMLNITIIMAAAITIGFLSGEGEASANDSPLVTTEYLAGHLDDPELLIIDTRTEANYGAGHIPGAVNLPYEQCDPYSEEEECLLRPAQRDMVSLLRERGVDNSSRVVVYDHGNTLSDATKGGAVCWLLRSLGHDDVSYLNGGFTKWTFEGRIIDNKVPEVETGDFNAGSAEAKIIDFEEVKDAMEEGSAVLVDARSSEQYFGASKRADVTQFGHIPGSLSLPAAFLNNAGPNRAPATIKDKDELARAVKGAGLPADNDQEIIVYCNTGQWAGMECLILKDILGYKDVSLYDGSVLEYAWKSFEPLTKYSWGHVKQ